MTKKYADDKLKGVDHYWADNRPYNIDAPEEPKQDTSIVKTFGYGFKAESAPVAWLTSDTLPTNTKETDPDYDTYEYVKSLGKSQIVDIFNPDDNKDVVHAKIKMYDESEKVNEYLDKAGGWGSAARFVGSVANGSTIIPILGQASKVGMGLKVVSSFAVNAALTGGVVALEEQVKRSADLTRSQEMSNFNIAAAATVAGLYGAGSTLISAGTKKATENLVKQALKGEPVETVSTAGAMHVSYKEAAEQLRPANLATGVTKFVGDVQRSPYDRLVSSPHATARNAANHTYKHGMILNQNKFDNITNPISLEQSLDEGFNASNNLMDKATQNYYKAIESQGILKSERAAIQEARGVGYTSSKFSEDVALAMRRGGDDVSFKPEVNATAKMFNASIDDMANKLVDAMFLSKEQLDETAKTNIKHYLTRYTNKEKLRSQSPEFNQRVGAYYKSIHPDLGEDEIAEKVSNLYESMLGLSDDDSVMQSLIREYSDGTKPKFIKNRSLMVPDEVIEPWLLNDGMQITKRFIDEGNKLLAAKEFFESQGATSLKGLLKQVDAEHTARVRAGEKLTEQDLLNSKNIIRESYESIMGISSNPAAWDPALRVARNLITTSTMGFLPFASVPVDAFMPIVKHGVKAYFTDGLLPIVTHLKSLNITADQYSDFVQGLKTTIGEAAMRITGQEDTTMLTHLGKAEALSRLGPRVLFKANAFSKINATERTMAVVVSGNQIIRKIKSQSPDDLASLRALGISPKSEKIILQQFKKHGAEGLDAMQPNPHLWDKTDEVQRALREYMNAVSTDVDMTIIQPGAGDIPITMQNNQIARAMGMFTSYFMATTNKILLSSANRGNPVLAKNAAILMSAGILSYIINTGVRGRWDKLDLSPDNLAIHALADSGFGGLLTQVPLRLFSTDSRFGAQTAADMLMGPIFSTGSRIVASSVKTMKGEMSAQDAENFIRLIPLMQIPVLRDLFGIDKETVKDYFKKNNNKDE